jgi:hypothetical protein
MFLPPFLPLKSSPGISTPESVSIAPVIGPAGAAAQLSSFR